MIPQRCKKGDSVAILSPSSTIAGVFPWLFEQGLDRLQTIFGLNPILMPHCLDTNATQEDRASDLHAAFLDPTIKAVFSCTGGIDQIQLINRLEGKIFSDNPKPFFGYSDNTHFCNFLYQNRVKSFYGGSILSQFAMQHQMCQETIESLKWALFDHQNWFEIKAPSYSIDEDHPWEDQNFLDIARHTEPNEEGLIFSGKNQAEGTLWGGCLESLADLLRIPSRIPKDFSNSVLFLETSEELPSHEFVRRFIISLGEAGILSEIKGLLVGRPKTWFFDQKKTPAEKKLHREKQKETILSVVRIYNQDISVVFNLSIGHTDPQLILPYGGKVRIDGKSEKVEVTW